MKQDILGNALLDYNRGEYTQDITTYSSLGDEDILPLPYMFRNFIEMPRLEQKALQLCYGKILDVGCGAGSHSLYLQEQNLIAVGLDVSPGAITVCNKRGLRHNINTGIMDFNESTFDTILLLMNGIGLAGQLNYLGTFLEKLKSLLNPGGQILLDSSDIIYMFETDDDGGYWMPDNGSYYGEISFEMKYKEEKSEPFPWLYVDFNTLQRAANYQNLNCELVCEGEHYDYLAKLNLIT